MKLEFDQPRLLDLMKDFHLLTGIRIVLFDDEYRQLLAWPKEDCDFCKCMKHFSASAAYCQESDIHSFSESRKEKKLIVYHCHAGLIEATVPLIENHVVIGYLMFGQISDVSSELSLQNLLHEAFLKYDLNLEVIQNFLHINISADCSWQLQRHITQMQKEIPQKTAAEIKASAKILEALTFYTVYNEIIMLRRQIFSDNLHTYIQQHLTENLDAASIAKGLGISRSKLYTTCNKYLGKGIAEYVRDIRIEYAKKMLKETTEPIAFISDQTGFGDYNYFCRVFKKKTGYSPKAFRFL